VYKIKTLKIYHVLFCFFFFARAIAQEKKEMSEATNSFLKTSALSPAVELGAM
jgi:hypothetical protein